jgi:Rrf2 family transcriptional regulator, cysteine metabolism repressor
MRISKRAEYGLTAMVHLAKNKKNKKAISIREISNIESVPFEFLSKIFACLERANLVIAKHGASGGYILAGSPQKITAGDVVSLLENMSTIDCKFCSKSKKCLTRSVWGRVDQAVGETLKSITLESLIR